MKIGWIFAKFELIDRCFSRTFLKLEVTTFLNLEFWNSTEFPWKQLFKLLAVAASISGHQALKVKT